MPALHTVSGAMPPRKKNSTAKSSAKDPPAQSDKAKGKQPAKSAASSKRSEREDSALARWNRESAESRSLASKISDIDDEEQQEIDNDPDAGEDEEAEEDDERPEWNAPPLGFDADEDNSEDDADAGASEHEKFGMEDVVVSNPQSPPRPAKKRTVTMRSPQEGGVKRPRKTSTPNGEHPVASSTPSKPPRHRSVTAPASAARRSTPAPPASPEPTSTSRKHQRQGSRKIVKAQWSRDENRLVDGAKEAFRAHAVMFAPFPPEMAEKASYYVDILRDYVESEYAPSHLKDVFEELCKDPQALEDLCTHASYAVADGVKKFCAWARPLVDTLLDTRAEPHEIRDLVEWYNLTHAFACGEFDAVAREFDSVTMYEARWMIGFLRRFLYDNPSKLDGYCIWLIHSRKGPTSFMWALIGASMLHPINDWRTGKHVVTSFKGPTAQDAFNHMMTGMSKMETEVPGWFDELREAVYKEASSQTNNDWVVKSFVEEIEKLDIDYSKVREKVEERQRAKAEREAAAAKAKAEAKAERAEAKRLRALKGKSAGRSSSRAGSLSSDIGGGGYDSAAGSEAGPSK
ncbi:hypothetical protein CYLTODRAFT_495333 [Cylindrobasidium torrendii FP15055 ss-10]|uniref:DUF6532 domain-containing protein n=1 Tax=Cylindrobasidium torrendii FP15055 ss-10 TaxID=1314674 RepID=A0A0D7ASE1_9AGAR|nr:hypothetical protein CYLTODRAFT_495333 [Cylindrobasidium torrendii FP15055 ss-10]